MYVGGGVSSRVVDEGDVSRWFSSQRKGGGGGGGVGGVGGECGWEWWFGGGEDGEVFVYELWGHGD